MKNEQMQHEIYKHNADKKGIPKVDRRIIQLCSF